MIGQHNGKKTVNAEPSAAELAEMETDRAFAEQMLQVGAGPAGGQSVDGACAGRGDQPGGGGARGPDVSADDASRLFSDLSVLLQEESRWPNTLRSLSTGWRYGIAIAVGLLIGAAGGLYPRADLSAYPVWRMALTLGSLTATLALALVWLLRPIYLPRSTDRGAIFVPLLLLALPTALALAPVPPLVHPASLAVVEGLEFWLRSAECFLYGGTHAVLLLALLALLDRGAMRPIYGGILLAVVAGAVGNLVLQLHCPIVDTSHLFAGHGAIGLVLACVFVAYARAARARAQG